MSFKTIEELSSLLNTYTDVVSENLIFQTTLLKKGFNISTKIFTKSPSVQSLLIKKGIPSHLIKYINSHEKGRRFDYTSKAKKEIVLFYDDLWTVEIVSPQLGVPSLNISGYDFIDKMKQGVNGVLPRMLKQHFNTPATDSRFKSLDITLAIKLNTDHDSYHKTLRGQMINSLKEKYKTPEEEITVILNPTNLFKSLFNSRPDSEDRELMRERLKLWNQKVSLKQFKNQELSHLIESLPLNTFGINDMVLLRNIAQSFHNKVSNEILLTGELNHSIFEDRQVRKLNEYLKLTLEQS